MKQFIIALFSDKGSVSSKRFVTILTTCALVVVVFVNLFTGKTVTDIIFNGLLTVVLGGLGVVASEKFASKKNTPIDEPKEEEKL